MSALDDGSAPPNTSNGWEQKREIWAEPACAGVLFRQPKVALSMEIVSDYDRGLLRGIGRFSRLCGPWLLSINGRDSELGWLKAEFTGIIARVRSLKQADGIKASNLPAVIIEASMEELATSEHLKEFSEIIDDSSAIAKMAADHFFERGLKSFAFCGWEKCPWSIRREQAFYRIVAERGFPCFTYRIDPPKSALLGNTVVSFAKKHSPLAGWLKSLPRPTGVMACNDMCGRNVLEACAAAGVSVPAHLAVLGVDNDELVCELSRPPLSSVALGLEQAGYQAAFLLSELMANRSERRKQVVQVRPLHVVERRSGDLIIKDDALVARALHFIKDRVGLGIRVPDVVDEAGVSRRTLERRFFRANFRSLGFEIRRSRLDRAKALLQETGLSVRCVAAEAGFSGTRMFYRIFRQMEGCSPTTFRRRLPGSASDYGRGKPAS
jgi:LacI family transcriptional regulator